VEIRRVDVADKQAMHRHWEIGLLAERDSRPYDFYPPFETSWLAYQTGRDDLRFLPFGAFEGDEMVGCGRIDLPELDNLHSAFSNVYVEPARRRQGIGRALDAYGVEIARAEGRRVLMSEAYAPIGEESAGTLFAASLGYTKGIEDAMKVVDLVETEHTWAVLEEKAAAKRGDYRIMTWRDHVPDEHVEAYCRLNEMFFDEAPTGELEVENEVWDAQRVEEQEKRNQSTGRHEIAAGAVAADGTLVGVTEIMVNERSAQRGFQSGTLVDPAHRGHALGLAIKLANHRQVREVFPQCRVLMTGNADVNAPMNAVNLQLGYQDVERCVEVQKAVV
jgi:GNAT superfamily N-acetyltransferase